MVSHHFSYFPMSKVCVKKEKKRGSRRKRGRRRRRRKRRERKEGRRLRRGLSKKVVFLGEAQEIISFLCL